MKNVLVFPCGSEIGLEIYRSLNHSIHVSLWGGSSVDDHGAFVYENYLSGLPFVDAPDLIEELNRVIKEYKIDYIFPAHDDAVVRLAEAAGAGKLACEVLTSNTETCKITRSKRLTYEAFEGVVPVPKLYVPNPDIDGSQFPLFLKPDIGQGSKGTQKVSGLDDVEFYLSKDPSLLLMEYLPGIEYTIDCFTDRNGTLLVAEGRERQRISNGISVSSARVDDDRFMDLAVTINEKLSLRGAWFFQVKERDSGELVLMEIAPRIAGTMGLIRNQGVNLALLTVFDRMGYDVDVIRNEHALVVDRALENRFKTDLEYSHVYLDFDDLLLINNKVNTAVIAFVYQCINKGIKIHLITKHALNLEETLNTHRLTGLFDEIIWLKKDDQKYEHMTEKDAIFIDDSFAERKAVFEKLTIPVFDSHMIESLIEKA